MRTKTILIGGAVVVVGYLAYQRYMAAQAATAQAALPDYSGSSSDQSASSDAYSGADGSYVNDGSASIAGGPGYGSGYMQPGGPPMRPPGRRHPGQWEFYGRHPNQYARRHPNRAQRWSEYDPYGDGGGY